MNHLYLHGFASSPGSAKAVAVKAALQARGASMDVPDLNVPDFTRLTIAAMVAEAERHLKPPAVLWGSSLGGYLAALLASRQPEAVQKLVLMAPAVEFPVAYPARVAEARPVWARGGTVQVFHHAAKRELPLAGDLVHDCENWPVNPRVRCPALVFAARRDEVIPLPSIERWVAEQPHARLVVLDDVHDLNASAPEILRQALDFAG